jgi:hypothetical protein
MPVGLWGGLVESAVPHGARDFPMALAIAQG